MQEVMKITVVTEWGGESTIYLLKNAIDYFYSDSIGRTVIYTRSGREFCTDIPFGEFYDQLMTGKI